MKWARKIKELRHIDGLQQDRLAFQLGVSQASISQWERGVAVPPAYIQQTILKRLEHSPACRQRRALTQSVAFSPNNAMLLRPEGEKLVIEEVSRAVPRDRRFVGPAAIGEDMRGLFGASVDETLAEARQGGLFDGKLVSMRLICEAQGENGPGAIDAVAIPFQLDADEWLLRTESRRMRDDEYAAIVPKDVHHHVEYHRA